MDVIGPDIHTIFTMRRTLSAYRWPESKHRDRFKARLVALILKAKAENNQNMALVYEGQLRRIQEGHALPPKSYRRQLYNRLHGRRITKFIMNGREYKFQSGELGGTILPEPIEHVRYEFDYETATVRAIQQSL